ncbi:WD40 repeat-like protein [Suillus decipiens]|nr:WD40 repeat-like protein [Suillus decipiens]
MASSSTQPSAAENNSILTPVIILKRHQPHIIHSLDGENHNEYKDISYFPDGKQMISGSRDKAIRRWDLQEGKEIEKAREYQGMVDGLSLALAVREEIETGTVRIFPEGHWIEISAGSTAGAFHSVWIWNLDTGEIVAGPFKFSDHYFGGLALRFSEDSRKLAVTTRHTHTIKGLALSLDRVLLASSSFDGTIKLWAFGSHQLFVSFDVEFLTTLVLSPDSRQLAHTTRDDTNIHICNIPANVLANIEFAEEPQPTTSKPKCPRRAGQLDFDVTPRPVLRNPITPFMSPIPQSLPTRDPSIFLHFLRKLIPSSSRMDAVRTNEPRNLLDFPATSPLPRPLMNPTKILDVHHHHPPPNSLSSILLQRSDYQPGGSFRQIIHRRLLLMFLTRWVNCDMLQQVLLAMMTA